MMKFFHASHINEVIGHKILWPSIKKNKLPLVCVSQSFKVILHSLMGLSSKFASPKTTIPTCRHSIGIKKCIV